MNYNHLQYFLVLSKMLHFSKAAEALHISQPSLSTAISNLEKELGVPLFERKGKSIVLTEYGKVFVAYVTKSLHELEKGVMQIEGMKDEVSDTLRLGFLYSLSSQFIPETVARYKQTHPSVHFDLFEGDTMTAETTVELLDGLKTGRFDVIFINRLMYQDADFSLIKLFEQNYVAVVSSESPLAKQSSLNLLDTKDLPLIQYKRKFGTKAEIYSLFESVSCPVTKGPEFDDESSIVNYVKHNLGFSVLPYSSALEQPGVTLLPISNPHFTRGIYVCYNKARRENTTVDHFINWLLLQ